MGEPTILICDTSQKSPPMGEPLSQSQRRSTKMGEPLRLPHTRGQRRFSKCAYDQHVRQARKTLSLEDGGGPPIVLKLRYGDEKVMYKGATDLWN